MSLCSIPAAKTSASSAPQPADYAAKQISKQVRTAAEQHAGEKFEEFTVIEYLRDTYYFLKVHVGGDRYVHVKSYVNVDKATLVALQAGKTKSDPLDHF